MLHKHQALFHIYEVEIMNIINITIIRAETSRFAVVIFDQKKKQKQKKLLMNGVWGM